MKLDRKFDRLAAGLFGFFAAFGGIGCIVTGMHFPGISMGAVAVTVFLATAVFALFSGKKWFGALPLALLLFGWQLWRKGSLNISVEALLSRITTLYHAGYGWGIIRWSDTALEPAFAQLALCAVGVLIALGVCWTYLKYRGIWLPALFTCLPVIPCMLLTDTVPKAGYLFLPLLCLVLLLLIRMGKRRGQGTALVNLLAIPAAIAVFLLFLLVPQEGSNNIKWADSLISYVQEMFEKDTVAQNIPALPQTPIYHQSNWVNLSTVGPKVQRAGKVMEVTARKSEYLYLRGTVYDAYWGSWWDNRESIVSQPESFPTDSLPVTITTITLHDVLYLPYGAYGITGSSLLLTAADGVVKNIDAWRSYTVQYRQLPDYEASWETPAVGLSNQYLQLPESTRAEALAYLEREIPELAVLTGVWRRATAIVSHVSGSATYNLRTGRMPNDRKDFAMWFLEESDTGYCTHFASAAAVLLRAAGIPCRYVTGYLVDARADVTVPVVHDNAHAWVECYVNGIGWVPLEPTPSGGISQTVGENITTPTETDATTPEVSLPPETTSSGETVETTSPDRPPVTQPKATDPISGTDKPQPKPTISLPWLKWILGCLAFGTLIVAQWRLRRHLRLCKRSRGTRSKQALARWQEISLHSWIRKCEPDRRMLELAQRAKFSQHAITREELKEMDAWLISSTDAIRTMGLWQKLLATLIYALY